MFLKLLLSIICLSLTLSDAKQVSFPHLYNFFNSTTKDVFLKQTAFMASNHKGEHTKLSIVHGEKATRGQFCYTAYLQFSDGRNYWACGGSLVTANTLLTAGHCVKGARSAVAVLGALNLSEAYEPGRKIIRVTSSGLIVHELYDTRNYYNDIALVRLNKPVPLNSYICTVDLPSCNSTGTTDGFGNYYNVSGWGKTSDRATTSTLMYVTVAEEPFTSCADYYKVNANYKVKQSQMCTSGAGSKGTCNGDSGGPLVQIDSSGNTVQRGIVSLGMSSCETSAASVYTDLTDFVTWLCPKLTA